MDVLGVPVLPGLLRHRNAQCTDVRAASARKSPKPGAVYQSRHCNIHDLH